MTVIIRLRRYGRGQRIRVEDGERWGEYPDTPEGRRQAKCCAALFRYGRGEIIDLRDKGWLRKDQVPYELGPPADGKRCHRCGHTFTSQSAFDLGHPPTDDHPGYECLPEPPNELGLAWDDDRQAWRRDRHVH